MVTGRSADFLDQAWTLCWHIPQTPVWSQVMTQTLGLHRILGGNHSHRWTQLQMNSHSYRSTTNQDTDLGKLHKHRHHRGPIGKLAIYISSSSSPLQPCFFRQQMNCPDFLSFFPISILYLLNIMVPKLCLPSKFPHRPRSGKWLVAVLIGVLILYKWWLLGIMC